MTVFDLRVGVYCHRQKRGDTMTEQQKLRDELFPDGMPEPEDFIRTLAAYILANPPEIPDGSEGESEDQ